MSNIPPPGKELLCQVRAAFVLQGTTLGAWCTAQGIVRQTAVNALVGGWNGPKGRALRQRVITASGLTKRLAA